MIAPRSYDFGALGEAERLAVLYAPKSLRPRFHVALALDAQLARIGLAAREPMLAQIKLAWWRDAVADPDAAGGAPLVRDITAAWPNREPLSDLIDGWEALAVGDGDWLARVGALAEARCVAFAAAASLAADDDCRRATRRWTLVTLAPHAANPDQRDTLLAAARAIGSVSLPRSLRPLAVLDGLARRSLRRGGAALLGDRLSPLAALRLGLVGR